MSECSCWRKKTKQYNDYENNGDNNDNDNKGNSNNNDIDKWMINNNGINDNNK